ncbi:MAG: Gldg family protein [Candidatus Bipolaricaulota bacterium]|nr:Gldg family protein [Candidatus Bipolaricaulota bacterium]
MKLLGVVLLVGTLGVVSQVDALSQSDRPRVLFDEAHDERNTISPERARILSPEHPEFAYYGRLAESLSYEFALERWLSPLDSAVLEGIDVVVIATPQKSFAPQELDALVRFVEQGGGLLVAQDANPSPQEGSNQLAERFGLRFRQGVLRSQHGDWDPETFRADVVQSDHPVVQGLDMFQMNWGCSIEETADWDVLFRSKEDTWQDVDGNRRATTGEPEGPLDVAVAKAVGNGRVVFIADNAFHDTIQECNLAFFVRATRWLADVILPSAGMMRVRSDESLTISPDVAQDSVVQTGEGPQELSTEIKFYPNARRIRPGEIAYWTLDLGDLVGPFEITPELNNDATREPEIGTDDSLVVISFAYEAAAIYVPYVLVRDGSGTTRKVFTRNVLGVIPELEQRERIGLKVPSLEDPIGDVVKGMQVMGLDERRFSTPEGEAGIKADIANWAKAGVNFVMYNIPLYVSNIRDNVTYPHYGEAAPTPWSATWHMDSITKLTDWAHEQDIRVAIRPFMMTAGDEGGTTRSEYQPTNLGLYFDYHVQIKRFLAELAESLGIEMFNIDAENPVTSLHEEALRVLDAIRSVFSGVVSDTTCVDTGTLALSPLHDYVDLIYVSLGPHHTDLGEAPLAQFVASYYTQMTNEVLPILYLKQKAGMLETFALQVPLGGEIHQARSYEGILEFLTNHPSILMGTTFWETSLDYVSAFDPFGHPAEGILTTYFGSAMPDSRLYCFENPLRAPQSMMVIGSFDATPSEAGFAVYHEDQGHLALSRATTGIHEGHGALRARFTSTAATNRGTYIAGVSFGTPRDWSAYSTFNIWVKTDGTSGGLHFELVDADGDRFTSFIATPPAESGWVLMIVRLEDFVQPTWCQRGDGTLDLHKIVRWTLGQNRWTYDATTSFETWFDSAYLGGPFEIPGGSVNCAAKQPAVSTKDTDGDGVPDDEDFCPDWPGRPEANGC